MQSYYSDTIFHIYWKCLSLVKIWISLWCIILFIFSCTKFTCIALSKQSHGDIMHFLCLYKNPPTSIIPMAIRPQGDFFTPFCTKSNTLSIPLFIRCFSQSERSFNRSSKFKYSFTISFNPFPSLKPFRCRRFLISVFSLDFVLCGVLGSFLSTFLFFLWNFVNLLFPLDSVLTVFL